VTGGVSFDGRGYEEGVEYVVVGFTDDVWFGLVEGPLVLEPEDPLVLPEDPLVLELEGPLVLELEDPLVLELAILSVLELDDGRVEDGCVEDEGLAELEELGGSVIPLQPGH